MPEPAPVTMATLLWFSLLIAGRYRSTMRGRPVAHALVSFVLAVGAFALADTVGAAPAALAAQSPDDFRDVTTVDVLARGAKPRDRLRLAFDEGSISVGVVRQDILTKQT